MTAGCPGVYDPDFHPQDCIEMGRNGKFEVQMADKWDVTPQTVSEWARKHKEFASALARAKAARMSRMLDRMDTHILDSKDCKLNFQTIAMMMRYDGINVDERCVRIPGMTKAKTLDDKANCILKALSSGKISSKEANLAMQSVVSKMSVEQGTTMLQRLEIVEQRQKLSENA